MANYVNPDDAIELETTIYISGEMEATGTAYINRPVSIVPVGNVTITRTSESDYIFSVNTNLTLQGSESVTITLSGDSEKEVPAPLIYCVGSATTDLQYCTLENANCGNSSYGSALYASNDSVINMSNCKVKNNTGVAVVLNNTGSNKIENSIFTANVAVNTGIYASAIYVSSETANVELINCEFSNNKLIKPNSDDYYFSDLGIEEATSVTLKACSFDAYDENNFNVYAYICPELNIAGSTKLPQLFFYNTYTYANLGIKVGENLSLIDETSINITAYYYDDTELSYDLDLEFFALEDGSSLPNGIFILNSADYTLSADGTITKKTE